MSEPKNPHPPVHASCERIRLVQSELAAVDRCECGTMTLHLGPMSLRLTPDAIHELGRLLQVATLKNRQYSESPDPVPSHLLRRSGS